MRDKSLLKIIILIHLFTLCSILVYAQKDVDIFHEGKMVVQGYDADYNLEFEKGVGYDVVVKYNPFFKSFHLLYKDSENTTREWTFEWAGTAEGMPSESCSVVKDQDGDIYLAINLMRKSGKFTLMYRFPDKTQQNYIISELVKLN